jgi:hypothetical protein
VLIGRRKLEVRGQKLEVRNRKLEAGSRKTREEKSRRDELMVAPGFNPGIKR